MADPIYAMPFEAQFDKTRAEEWIILRLLRGLHTATLVVVDKVTPTAELVGFVDVTPLVLDVDTSGTVIKQAPIYNVPFFRFQGGKSAVVLDPVAGDVGLCMFAERDITALKAKPAPGPAPTARAHSSADGLYLGGVLNGDPTQWVKFLPGGGIDISSSGDLTLEAAGKLTMTATGAMTITAAALQVNAPTTFADPITAPDLTVQGVGSVKSHVHGGVQTGSGNTGAMSG